jgi:hypothetical protein
MCLVSMMMLADSESGAPVVSDVAVELMLLLLMM